MKHAGRSQNDYQFKFVMVGDSAVGKSSLLIRFVDNQFNQNYMTTIGVDFRFKSIVLDGKKVKVQIWDTAGQERFRTIVNTYYKNAHCVYLIFDLGSPETFNSIRNYWINQVESYTDEKTINVLIGNKSDQTKAVSEEEIQKFVESKNLQYFQTSAKTTVNINQMFYTIAKILIEKRSQGQGKGNSTEGAHRLQGQTQNQGAGSRLNCNC